MLEKKEVNSAVIVDLLDPSQPIKEIIKPPTGSVMLLRVFVTLEVALVTAS
ncbi:hypothetical protein V1503_11520 [Bacillus sp. SCS-151]|uniref:hypothetical protein n=1 Tax=Nanhaiella sioensis TaxID=3115293 RepID=UPI003977E9A6